MTNSVQLLESEILVDIHSLFFKFRRFPYVFTSMHLTRGDLF